MKKLLIAYSNMWGQARAFHADYLLDCFPFLAARGGPPRFELSKQPQLVFYSVYGYVRDRYEGAVRFLYSGEPGDHFKLGAKIGPGEYEAGFYHYGVTCEAEVGQSSVVSGQLQQKRHAYMPQGVLHLNLYNDGVSTLIRRTDNRQRATDYFCNFIYSNGNSRRRVEFFHKLNARKRVESCGAVERNNDTLVKKAAYSREGYLLKQAFQARCKFTIAFENTVFPGYNTEKLTDPFVAGSVPIYWGDPEVKRFWNPDAFICVSDFPDDEAAIDYILKVDADEDLYEKYASAPPFRGNVVPEELSEGYYREFFGRMLEEAGGR